jgi:hypothetical protein
VIWALLVDRQDLLAAASRVTVGVPDCGWRFAPVAPLRLANTETGEIREWRGGLDRLMEGIDEDATLLGRIAEALGPDVLRRWEDGDESLDLAAEVRGLVGLVQSVSEALNCGDGSYRP